MVEVIAPNGLPPGLNLTIEYVPEEELRKGADDTRGNGFLWLMMWVFPVIFFVFYSCWYLITYVETAKVSLVRTPDRRKESESCNDTFTEDAIGESATASQSLVHRALNRALGVRGWYYPCMFAVSPESQYRLAMANIRTHSTQFKRQLVKSADGLSVLALDVTVGNEGTDTEKSPVLIFCASYCYTVAQEIAAGLQRAGRCAVVVNGRIHSSSSATLTHLSDLLHFEVSAADARLVMSQMGRTHPSGFHVIGLSFGADVAIRCAAQRFPESKLLSLMCISTPFLRGGEYWRAVNQSHQNSLMAARKSVLAKQSAPNDSQTWSSLLLAETVTQFEAEARCFLKSIGVKGVGNECEGSVDEDVSQLKVPTLFLHAKDDPVHPFHWLTRCESLKHNPAAGVVYTTLGSHVSWLQGFIPLPGVARTKLSSDVVDWVSAVDCVIQT